MFMLITQTYALTLYNITLNSTDNTTSVIFDESTTLNYADIGSDFVYLDSFLVSGCAGSYDYNFTSVIAYSSNFSSFITCQVPQDTQTDFDSGLASIIILSIGMIVLVIVIGSFVPVEYMKYVFWVFLALTILAASNLLF